MLYYLTSELINKVLKNFNGLAKYTYKLQFENSVTQLIILQDDRVITVVKMPEVQTEFDTVAIVLPVEYIQTLRQTPLKYLPEQLAFDINDTTYSEPFLDQVETEAERLVTPFYIGLLDDILNTKYLDPVVNINRILETVEKLSKFTDYIVGDLVGVLAVDKEDTIIFDVAGLPEYSYYIPIKDMLNFLVKIPKISNAGICEELLRINYTLKVQKKIPVDVELDFYLPQPTGNTQYKYYQLAKKLRTYKYQLKKYTPEQALKLSVSLMNAPDKTAKVTLDHKVTFPIDLLNKIMIEFFSSSTDAFNVWYTDSICRLTCEEVDIYYAYLRKPTLQTEESEVT